jgi:sugar phosphate isomerase/epimerase
MRYIMERGSILAVVLVLAIAGCWSGPVQEGKSAKTTRMTNPLAIRLSNYGRFQEAAWTHLPLIGLHYVFIDVPKPEELAMTRHRLARHGLAPLVLRGETDLGQPHSLDELTAQLAICEKMGVKYMFLSPKHTGMPKEAAYERLRRVGEIASKHGVTVALETHPDLGTNGDVHQETMKHVNHPNIRVNFDTGNITFYNKGTDAVTELKKVIDYVATVELKDHDGKYKNWNFPVLGKGVVDFPSVLRLLERQGFQGPLTIEVEGVQGVEMDESQTKSYIARSVAYIKSLGEFR